MLWHHTVLWVDSDVTVSWCLNLQDWKLRLRNLFGYIHVYRLKVEVTQIQGRGRGNRIQCRPRGPPTYWYPCTRLHSVNTKKITIQPITMKIPKHVNYQLLCAIQSVYLYLWMNTLYLGAIFLYGCKKNFKNVLGHSL